MLKAEEVLCRAKTALQMLESEENEEKIEVLWIACVTLLRSIGHVLSKIDSKNYPKLKQRVDEWWIEVKSDKENIFNQFIELERNFTLKEFSISYNADQMLGMIANDQSIEMMKLNDDFPLYLPLISGKYIGEDIRDVIAEAIDWWEYQLNVLKSQTEKNKP